jgi:hypothetical protein
VLDQHNAEAVSTLCVCFGDAFDDAHEYVAIAAERIWAMLMTPTCDLDDLVVWSVWPLYTVEGAGADVERALAALSHPTLLRLPTNDRFPDSTSMLQIFVRLGGTISN